MRIVSRPPARCVNSEAFSRSFASSPPRLLLPIHSPIHLLPHLPLCFPHCFLLQSSNSSRTLICSFRGSCSKQSIYKPYFTSQMAWWQGLSGEPRLLIAPDQGSAENNSGNLISLRHPKSGTKTTYLVINGSLQELHWFKQAYGSWFLGDYVSEDGSLYTSTTVDPVFIMLPIFEEARMKKGDDLGKFRQIDEMIFIDGYPGYQQLSSILEKSMNVVCEVKEIGSTKFFRLDDSKVLAWLCRKVERLKDTLLMLDKNYAAQDEKQTLASVVSIMGEYLKEEPWLNLLCSHLGLSPQDITGKNTDSDTLHMENVLGSSSQEKSQMDKKTTKTGRQAKKVKIETDSRNIRDMFARASKRASKA